MTAPLNNNMQNGQQGTLLTDFIQTVQLNQNLDSSLVKFADINQKDTFEHTALYWSIFHHNQYNLKLLLKHNASCSFEPTGDALLYAIECNNIEALKELMLYDEKKSGISKLYLLLEYAKKLSRNDIINYLDQPQVAC